MAKIVECVPNFSEGRNLEVVEKIAGAFRAKEGVKLLDYSADKDHNRMVVTAAGEPGAMKRAVVEAIGIAVANIDLTKHEGQHPRMGAVDVVPFIPIKEMTMEDFRRRSRVRLPRNMRCRSTFTRKPPRHPPARTLQISARVNSRDWSRR